MLDPAAYDPDTRLLRRMLDTGWTEQEAADMIWPAHHREEDSMSHPPAPVLDAETAERLVRAATAMGSVPIDAATLREWVTQIDDQFFIIAEYLTQLADALDPDPRAGAAAEST